MEISPDTAQKCHHSGARLGRFPALGNSGLPAVAPTFLVQESTRSNILEDVRRRSCERLPGSDSFDHLQSRRQPMRRPSRTLNGYSRQSATLSYGDRI
ncbi:hypothetical protein PsYK624_070300 [Phanerochaete sordida]|uniref:Uncharacterized protein n=1 Tax=Phanerochaete sordida TaxID=48140 RepID=A0A9P3GBK6_9APHY|nr:hypothetical protein PsYK624_070300 [Phanerochaete sordida]